MPLLIFFFPVMISKNKLNAVNSLGDLQWPAKASFSSSSISLQRTYFRNTETDNHVKLNPRRKRENKKVFYSKTKPLLDRVGLKEVGPNR